jgi:hypothetical protein
LWPQQESDPGVSKLQCANYLFYPPFISDRGWIILTGKKWYDALFAKGGAARRYGSISLSFLNLKNGHLAFWLCYSLMSFLTGTLTGTSDFIEFSKDRSFRHQNVMGR